MKIEPVTLEGERVRLEPLTINHYDALCDVGLDEELWRLTTVTADTPEKMRVYLEEALKERDEKRSLPFATVDRATNKVVGSTRFGNIDTRNRRVEIGWTWIAKGWQQTHINTEAKYLMLRHAFETWKCIRVELKTDSLNERSQNAMLRIGAKQEGTLRNHMITHTGRYRHSIYFSFIESEWQEAKARLEEMIKRY